MQQIQEFSFTEFTSTIVFIHSSWNTIRLNLWELIYFIIRFWLWECSIRNSQKHWTQRLNHEYSFRAFLSPRRKRKTTNTVLVKICVDNHPWKSIWNSSRKIIIIHTVKFEYFIKIKSTIKCVRTIDSDFSCFCRASRENTSLKLKNEYSIIWRINLSFWSDWKLIDG